MEVSFPYPVRKPLGHKGKAKLARRWRAGTRQLVGSFGTVGGKFSPLTSVKSKSRQEMRCSSRVAREILTRIRESASQVPSFIF